MIVNWEVEDGYVGGGRLQSSEIPDEDLEGMSDAEKSSYIDTIVQEDFLSNITWNITDIEE